MSLYILKSLQAAFFVILYLKLKVNVSAIFASLGGFMFWIVLSEKEKTSKPVKLEVCAIQIYMYCYGGYFAHN